MEDLDSTPPPTPLLARVASWLCLPAAPLYGVGLAYLVYHPPRRRYHRTPADVGVDVEEVHVRAGSVDLHLWVSKGGSRERVVVIGHGIGLSKSASLAHAQFLHAAGYTVCLFDHRNHGKSSQDRAFWGLSDRFTDDVEAVVAHVREHVAAHGAKVAVYGFSFSSFPSFYVLGRDGCEVDAVVCESGPGADVNRIYRNFVDTGAMPVSGPFRRGAARRTVERTFGTTATAMLQADWPPAARGAFTTTPMLFLAGEEDPIVPPEEIRALAEGYDGATVRSLPGSAHLQGLKVDPSGYPAVVLEFLERTIGSP